MVTFGLWFNKWLYRAKMVAHGKMLLLSMASLAVHGFTLKKCLLRTLAHGAAPGLTAVNMTLVVEIGLPHQML
jgi:hypothetical protein